VAVGIARPAPAKRYNMLLVASINCHGQALIGAAWGGEVSFGVS